MGDSTFIVSPPTDNPSDDGEMRQRPPISAAEFSHMFTPLTLEQMFKPAPAQDDGTSTRTSASITGMLWRNGGGGGSGVDGSIGSAGDTLKQLLSNGSNPAAHEQSSYRSSSQQQQQAESQQPQQYMRPAPMADNESFAAPYSPPDSVASPSSAQEDAHYQGISAAVAADIRRPESARLPVDAQPPVSQRAQVTHRRSALMEGRRIPLIPNSPHLRPGSRASMVSLGSTSTGAHRAPMRLPEAHRSAPVHAPMPQNIRAPFPIPQERGPPATADPQMHRMANRPAPMQETSHADYYSHPLQIHSAVGPGSRQPLDSSLRHEVLDKVARRSQPTTPHDMHIPLPSSQRPVAVTQPLHSSLEYGYVPDGHSGTDITMLPGDNRTRAYMWGSGDGSEQAASHYDMPQPQHGTAQRPSSGSRFGSLRKVDYPGVGQARKSSDSSAHLLTPKDFQVPLPDRIGDMVLDKEIGEWVNINDYSGPSRGASPVTQRSQPPQPPPPPHQEAPQQEDSSLRTGSRGPASQRSSISLHSHTSAFPLPLPTGEKNSAGPYGIGLISPVENQRKHVHEMAERKPVRRGTTASRERPIEDEALGSIVQRLMTPAASPEACTALDLSGSGIRNLAGLSQITSRLEAICLSGNKLQSLAGLPMGLVSLRAPSNWIRFSPTDRNKFVFARELPHLEEIDLSANEISDIGVFSNLRHLRVLDISRNRIDSLEGLRGCRRLLHLRMRDNNLTAFDLEPAEAPLLTTLDLVNNRLRVVPSAIADFAQLTKVNMMKNDLEWIELCGPAAESLRELRLSENPLIVRRAGGIVDLDMWMAKYPGLRTLYMDVCNVRQMCRSGEDSSPPVDDLNSMQSLFGEGSGWPSLFNLSLRGNALRAPLEIDFACLCHLKNLYTPDTLVTLPRSLPQMNHLLQLVMCNAGLDRLPENMGMALPNLKLLDVSSNPELVDFTPIVQMAGSLEVLRCRAVGFGGLSDVVAGGAMHGRIGGNQDAGDEQAMLRWLSKLRRLRRLDMRFNKCTADLYAAPPLPASAVGSSAALDGVLSPQMPGQSVMGEAGHPGLGSVGAVPVPSTMTRVDEEVWLRQDHAYLAGLKANRQLVLLRRRENYWATATRQFPRLDELDGIKISGSR
ncbi:Leucine-rich repeat protein [Coemansia sp. RSA 552]|nr:Leucine-rich repeat protein [Coemansia sp. RSA 552]